MECANTATKSCCELGFGEGTSIMGWGGGGEGLDYTVNSSLMMVVPRIF